MIDLYDDEEIYSYENIAMFEEPVPMDTLVEMCRSNQIEIKNLFISDITHQFLDYVAHMDTKDYNNMSSFIVFASTLLEMKSQSLLPPTIDDSEFYMDNPDDENYVPDRDYFNYLAADYDVLHDACDLMQSMQVLNRFYREPMFDENDYNIVIKSFNINKLITVFTMMLEKREFSDEKPLPKTIFKERFTVSQRMREIVEIIRAYKVVKFTSLFEKDYSKVEKVNTFLALLEILKQRVATAVQEVPFGEITITYEPATDKFNAEEITEDADINN